MAEQEKSRLQTTLDAEVETRRSGRQNRKLQLNDEVERIREEAAREVERIRDQRSVLHWSAYTSSIVEPDQENLQRKEDATTLSEWQQARNDEVERVQNVHHERLQALVHAKRGTGLRIPAPAATTTINGTGVFVEVDAAGSGEIDLESSFEPRLSTGERDEGSPALSADDETVEPGSLQSMYECQPPITMLAAARTYRTIEPKPLPPFGSSAIRMTS